MTIAFDSVPADVLVPGFYAEINPRSQAGAGSYDEPSLLVGQMLSAGSATAGTVVRVLSAAAARTLFGEGSSLAQMCAAYLANDPGGELWALPIADNGAGTAANTDLTFSGTATAAGTVRIWVGGRYIDTAVASGDAAADVAAAFETAINAADDIAATGATVSAVCTVTARHKGTVGNQITIRLDPDLDLPAGITVTELASSAVVALSSGATDPTTDGPAAIGDTAYDAIGLWLSDDTTCDAWKTELVSRWGATVETYGHVFACMVDTVTNVAAHADDRANAHETVLAVFKPYSPAYEIAAAYMGAAMKRLRNDPAANLTGVPILGVKGPHYDDRNTYAEAQVLLAAGAATVTVDRSGVMYIERLVTTYLVDTGGAPDTSYQDTQTLTTTVRFVRRMKARVVRAMTGAKLADDGTPIGAGRRVATPSSVRAEILAEYRQMIDDGLCEDLSGFDADLTVERNGVNPQRLDVLLPPDYVNQYLITGAVVRFGV